LDEERFRVNSPVEILSALRDAMAQNALLTLGIGSQNETAITALLDVDAAEQCLVLDAFAKPEMTAKVMSAYALTVETDVRRIRIRFDSGRASPTTCWRRSRRV
jgi:c-di-GMP-binding flagellar brake protein YcgR